MDPMTIVGIIVGLLAIVVSTLMDGNSFGALIGPSSLVLVVMGTIGVTMAGFQVGDVKRAGGAASKAFSGSVEPPTAVIATLVDCAETARREGVLALEPKIEDIDERFLKMGLQQVVDGMDADAVKEMLEIEIMAIDQRHQTMISFFKSMGGYAPTMGMIGTVIGLINMLGNLSDPEQLGLGLSVALLTTLYGVIFANLVFMPIANKLQRLHGAEMEQLDLALDGVLAVQAGASPRALSERLRSFLPPGERDIDLQPGTAGSAEAAPEAA